MNNQKLNNLLKDPNTNWRYIAIVAIVAALGLGGILAYQNFWPGGQEISLPEGQAAKEETPEGPANWKTYRNDILRYKINLPADWVTPSEHMISWGAGHSKAQFRMQKREENNRYAEIFIFEMSRPTMEGREDIFAGRETIENIFSGCAGELGSTKACIEKHIFVPSENLAIIAGVYVENAFSEAKKKKPDITSYTEEINQVLQLDQLYQAMMIDQILSTFRFLE